MVVWQLPGYFYRKRGYSVQRLSILISVVLVLLIGTASANGQRHDDPAAPQSGYDLSWSTIDGGGATPAGSTGGSYSLGGTIGQADAGTPGGGTYTLNGGFWGGAVTDFSIYLPLMIKNG